MPYCEELGRLELAQARAVAPERIEAPLAAEDRRHGREAPVPDGEQLGVELASALQRLQDAALAQARAPLADVEPERVRRQVLAAPAHNYREL